MIKRAMIFSAGLGTRFKPWTNHHPKALAIVNGKPLLQRNIEYLQHYGINEVVVNIHHFADQVLKAIEQNNGWGSKVIISNERETLLETGGGLLHAAPHLKNEDFITVNVDVLTDLDIHKLVAYHQQHNSLISFGVQQRSTSRYLLFDDNMRLSGWENIQTGEKRIVRDTKTQQSMAYSCVAVYQPEVLDLIPQRGKFSITESFLSLAADHVIKGYDHTGDNFTDVGKPDSVAIAEKLFK